MSGSGRAGIGSVRVDAVAGDRVRDLLGFGVPLRGERVPTIARDLFLSQSTVRNHLSAIYRRVGVHSQAELVARLLPGRGASVGQWA